MQVDLDRLEELEEAEEKTEEEEVESPEPMHPPAITHKIVIQDSTREDTDLLMSWPKNIVIIDYFFDDTQRTATIYISGFDTKKIEYSLRKRV
eukprot:UN28070